MKVEIDEKGKAAVEIHDYDLWDMDRTIAIVVHPMLVKYRAENHGYFFVKDEDVPDNLQSIEDRWAYVVDEMIFAFGSKLRYWEGDFKTGVFDCTFGTWKDEEGTHAGFRNGPNHTQKVDYDGIKECEKRIRLGFKLFGIYYQGLWN